MKEKNGSREYNHEPLGVVYDPFEKIWYRLSVYKIWQLYSFSHSWDINAAFKI